MDGAAAYLDWSDERERRVAEKVAANGCIFCYQRREAAKAKAQRERDKKLMCICGDTKECHHPGNLVCGWCSSCFRFVEAGE